MLSSRGSAIAVPIPRRTVRRPMAFFVMKVICSSPLLRRRARYATRLGRRVLDDAHLKRHALHDPFNKRCPAVIVGSGLPLDLPDGREIVILHAAAQGPCQKLLGEGADKLFAAAQQEIPQ